MESHGDALLVEHEWWQWVALGVLRDGCGGSGGAWGPIMDGVWHGAAGVAAAGAGTSGWMVLWRAGTAFPDVVAWVGSEVRHVLWRRICL